MEREMLNINANLINEPTFGSFMREDEEVKVANFTLAKGYGKGKEYINCAVYGDKSEAVRDFQKSDFIHIFGYFSERVKNDRTYRNFIVMSCNKIEEKEESETVEE